MHNINLLDSLMGASGTRTGTAKNPSRSNAGPEVGEKFHNILEQARPKVAAPPPPKIPAEVTVKKAAAATVPEKPVARPHHKNERVEKPVKEQATPAREVERERVETQGNRQMQKEGESEHSSVEKSANNDVAQTDPASLRPNEAAHSPILPEAALARTRGELEGELVEISITELDENTGQPLSLDTAPLSLVDAGMEPSFSALGADVGSDTDTSNQTRVAAEAGLTAMLGLDSEVVSASLPYSSGQVASTSGNGTLLGQISVDQALNPGSVLEVSAAQSTESALASADGSADVELTLEENPDFMLLSGKAKAGNLADSAIAVEKAALVVDTSKGNVPSILAESPLRPGETPSPAARSFVVQTGVSVPVGQPQWSQAVGEKVLWLAAQNVSAAEIRLDPPDLGPMQVKVSVNQDQASVSFTSPHPVVREALDQQLNRLREMFTEQGLNLVNVDVSDQPAYRQHDDEAQSGKSSPELDDEDLEPVATSLISSLRLVDHYA